MALRSRIPEIVAQLDPATAAALETAANLVEDRAKERVPVESGRLKRAIHTKFDVKRGHVDAYVIAGDNEAWYGHLVEHGTTHSPAHPFLIPALEESRADIARDVADVLRKIAE